MISAVPASLVIELEGIEPQIDRLAEDWTQGVDHGGARPVKIVATKHRTVEVSRIHPANSALTHEVVAKLTLGIDPDAQPRWG